MTDDIAMALDTAGVRGDYEERPAYQRNDYLGWIERSKRIETRSRRIAQMLEELACGGVYMGMVHAPSSKEHA